VWDIEYHLVWIAKYRYKVLRGGVAERARDLLRLLLTRPRMAVAVARFGARGLGPATEAIRRGDRETALRLLGTAILGRDRFVRLDRERLEQARANLVDAELLGTPFAPLDADQVRSVRCPVLLVGGDRSPAVFHHLLGSLHRLLPRAERVRIAGASHLVHEDQPAAYASAVLSFLLPRASVGTTS